MKVFGEGFAVGAFVDKFLLFSGKHGKFYGADVDEFVHGERVSRGEIIVFRKRLSAFGQKLTTQKRGEEGALSALWVGWGWSTQAVGLGCVGSRLWRCGAWGGLQPSAFSSQLSAREGTTESRRVKLELGIGGAD